MNADTPFGLRPHRHHGGGLIRYTEYPIASGYATDIVCQDAVKLAADGTIQRAAAGDTILGVFMGCRYVNSEGKPRFSAFWPASTVDANARAMVIDDPDVEFEIQANGDVEAVDVGTNADLAVSAGDKVFGVSRMELDAATKAAGSAQLRILGRVDDPTNAYGTNVKLRVLINEHALRSTAGI